MVQSPCLVHRLPVETLRQIFRSLLKPIPRYEYYSDPDSYSSATESEDSAPIIENSTSEVKPSTAIDSRALWLKRFPFADRRDYRHRLVPLAMVCKSWHSVANDILYTEVYVAGKSLRM